MADQEIDFETVDGETLTIAQLKQGLKHFQADVPQARQKVAFVEAFVAAQKAAKQKVSSSNKPASQVIDIDYQVADPESLTVVQLKQGITYFGEVPSGGKRALINDFRRLQNSFAQNNESNNGLENIQADDKTQQVDLEAASAINAFLPEPIQKEITNNTANDDLTQTAFQITGTFPTSNEPFRDKLKADRQKYSDQVNTPKKLKANFEFERTPQSVQLDSFVQAPGGDLAQTRDFNTGVTDSGQMGTALNYTAHQLTALRENAAGINDDADVAKLNSTVQKTIQNQKKSVTFNQVSMAAELNQHSGSIQNVSNGKYQPKSILKDPKSKLGIDDLVVERRQNQARSLHFVDRDSITKISIQKPESRQQQLLQQQHQKEQRKKIRKERTLSVFMWIGIIFIIALLGCHIVNVISQRRIAYIPILSSTVNSFFIFLLPNKELVESTSYSLHKPKHCPHFGQCDRNNQVDRCYPGYKKTSLNKLRYVSDFKFKFNNYLVYLREIHINIKQDNQKHTKQKEIYLTDICAKNIKEIAKYRRTLRQIENNILKIYGDEYCQKPNLKQLKRKKMNESQILDKIRKDKPVCLNDLFAYQRLNDNTKKEFLQLLDSDNLQFVKQDTLSFINVENISISEAFEKEKEILEHRTDEVVEQEQQKEKKTEYQITNYTTYEESYMDVIQNTSEVINNTEQVESSQQEQEQEQEEYKQLIDKCLFQVEAYSSPKKNTSCHIRMLIMMHKMRIIYQFLRLCILLALAGIGYVQFKCSVTASRIYREIKLELIKIKHRELSNDASSSCAQYALKSESLKYKYLSDHLLKEKIWKQVERKLQNDIQVDKQWARTRNGTVTEAYYYNGDALIKIKREIDDTNYRNDDYDQLSEHSLSY